MKLGTVRKTLDLVHGSTRVRASYESSNSSKPSSLNKQGSVFDEIGTAEKLSTRYLVHEESTMLKRLHQQRKYDCARGCVKPSYRVVLPGGGQTNRRPHSCSLNLPASQNSPHTKRPHFPLWTLCVFLEFIFKRCAPTLDG